MRKSNFDELLERYLEGKLNEEERLKLEAWLDAQKTAEAEGMELSKEEEAQLFEKIKKNISSIEEVLRFEPLVKKKRKYQAWWRVAASLLIVCSVAYLLWQYAEGRAYQLEVIGREGVEKIILNDGSIVWLQAGSKLKYHSRPGASIRHTEFEGEALFEVAKDAQKPFVIESGGLSLQVLGTSFNVKSDGEVLELAVLSGKVKLYSEEEAIDIEVSSNESVRYKNGSLTEIGPIAIEERNRIIADTEYDMQFEQAALSEVLARMERKFAVRIQLEEEGAGLCRLTADFSDQSLELSLQMIAEVLDISYTLKGKQVLIKGKACTIIPEP